MAAPRRGPFAASLPELYERHLVEPLFRPFAAALLDRAGLASGDRLLDVACGTGIVARLAREALGGRGRVVGVDASPGMLGVARRVAPAIEWREGDAVRLPLRDDERFELVACHQGLQFVADKASAIREMRRAIAPGGRVAIGTWRPIEEVPLISDLQRVAERHLGPITDQRHSLGDAGALESLLADGGLRAIQIETVTRTVRLRSGADVFARLNATAVVGMSGAARTMRDEQRAQIVGAVAADSIQALQPYLAGGDLVFEIGSNMAIARA